LRELSAANSRPEPVFKHFSNTIADRSSFELHDYESSPTGESAVWRQTIVRCEARFDAFDVKAL
jgi:hypothetical protein